VLPRTVRAATARPRGAGPGVPAAAGPRPTPTRPAICLGTVALYGAGGTDLRLTPPTVRSVFDVEDVPMAWFPDEPRRFVGRTAAMAGASRALAPTSRRTAVLFHGMAGTGRTACALELAYRHQDVFAAAVFWQA